MLDEALVGFRGGGEPLIFNVLSRKATAIDTVDADMQAAMLMEVQMVSRQEPHFEMRLRFRMVHANQLFLH
jgi:hypothetical protein